MLLPKNFRVRFKADEHFFCYHDLNEDDNGEMKDFGYHLDAKGRKLPQCMEKNVDAILARHLLKTFPNHFELVKGTMAKVEDEATKFEVATLEQNAPGAGNLLSAAQEQINRLTAAEQDSIKKIAALEKAMADQKKQHESEIAAIMKKIDEPQK
jgi:hypothetical protein